MTAEAYGNKLEAFVRLVWAMRAKQRVYFRRKTKDVLLEAKLLEGVVDAEIERLLAESSGGSETDEGGGSGERRCV